MKPKEAIDANVFKGMGARLAALGITTEELEKDYDPEENRRIGEREATIGRRERLKINLMNIALESTPPKFMHSTLDNWEATTTAHQAIMAKVRRISEYSVTICCGETRRGKSHILHAWAKETAARGLTCGYYRWAQLASWFSRPYSPSDSFGNEKSPFERIMEMDKCHLLMVDDLNADELPPHIVKQLFELIEHRESYQRPIVIVSNMSKDDIVKSFGFFWNKVNSRLMEGNGQFIDFNTIPEWRASVNK